MAVTLANESAPVPRMRAMEPFPPVAGDVVRMLVERGLTIATAESLTGGRVGALVTSVPGSSAAYVGGVIAYASRLKVELLGVPDDVVERFGVVSAPCARAMAEGVRSALDADLGVSTTGVAGPDSQEGKPAGLVYVAVADGRGQEVRELRLDGDRASVRRATAEAALELVRDRMGESTDGMLAGGGSV
jgi:PncC family amidohydrolase